MEVYSNRVEIPHNVKTIRGLNAVDTENQHGFAVFVVDKNGEGCHRKAHVMAFWLDVASNYLDDVAIINGRCQRTA